jgi:hypothetical protein
MAIETRTLKVINTDACPVTYYYVHPLFERRESLPSACSDSVTPTNYFSDTEALEVGTRLYEDGTLTTEAISGFYKRQDVNGVVGYTPGAGVDSVFSCD